MDAETALEFIDSLMQKSSIAKPNYLDIPERLIIKGVWNGQTYNDMAAKSTYEPTSLRNVGGKLWKKIGELLGCQVSRHNAQQVIEAAWQKQTANSPLQPTLPDWRKAKKMHPSWQAHPQGIGGISVCADPETFVTGGWDGTIKWWDLTTGKPQKLPIELGTETHHYEDVAALLFTPDGNTLISASYDFTIKLWALNTGEMLDLLRKNTNKDRPHTLYNHERQVEALALSPDGQILASGDLNGDLHLWDLRQPRSLQQLSSRSQILAIAFSPDGQKLACGRENGTISVWDLHSIGKSRTPKWEFDSSNGWISALTFAPDGKKIYSGNERGEVEVWDTVRDKKNIDRWQCHQSAILNLTFHPQDANLLVSGGYDRQIVFWNLKGGKPLQTLAEHEGAIVSMSFDRSGNVLVVGDEFGNITLWHTLDRSSLSS